ncbi:hypothetical protein Tco_1027370, partial [Tanacetum coccineum]
MNYMIIKEFNALKFQGVDLLANCKLRVGSGMRAKFWSDIWIRDTQLCFLFPRLYALENNNECLVAEKMQGSITGSFRRSVRGGVDSQQLEHLQVLIEAVVLSNADDRWVWDLNWEGTFHVKDARKIMDDFFLPKASVATRWIKYVPIKINVFTWKLHLDRLPTRVNLVRRGV